jgi:hypothetical protein
MKLIFSIFAKQFLFMTYKQTYTVTDNTLVITLPLAFKDKQVVVTIGFGCGQRDKLSLMKQASLDPLYLADMNEVNDDFKNA